MEVVPTSARVCQFHHFRNRPAIKSGPVHLEIGLIETARRFDRFLKKKNSGTTWKSSLPAHGFVSALLRTYPFMCANSIRLRNPSGAIEPLDPVRLEIGMIGTVRRFARFLKKRIVGRHGSRTYQRAGWSLRFCETLPLHVRQIHPPTEPFGRDRIVGSSSFRGRCNRSCWSS